MGVDLSAPHHWAVRRALVPDLALPDLAQTHVEELRRLRAAEESALTALADEELAARFNGDVTLTVRDEAITVLSPEQARAAHLLCKWARLQRMVEMPLSDRY